MTWDLVGKRFSRLSVLSRHAINSPSNKVRWVCDCDCGTTTLVTTQALIGGNTKSCGCMRVDVSRLNGQRRTTHGLTGTSEYKAWQSMRDRCYNRKCDQYKNYGARGIQVCQRWLDSFENFLEDMGPKPDPSLSIDRENNDGNYEPNNCRWASATEQNSNKRTNRKFIVDGVERTLTELAYIHDIPVATLQSRVHRDGISIEKALKRKASKHNAEHNGEVRRLHEWAEVLDIPYLKLYHHVVTKGDSLVNVISKFKGDQCGFDTETDKCL